MTSYPGGGSGPGVVGPQTGIMAAMRELNQLHRELADQGFNQVRGLGLGRASGGI